MNKKMQLELRKEISFASGIDTLLKLRSILFETVESFFGILSKEDFSAMPYVNAKGFHNKNVAYSIWHIFRIEDIVVNSLIRDVIQVFFTGKYQRRINSDIITTGNELIKSQITDFSKKLDLKELWSYASEVKTNTDVFLRTLSYNDMNKKFSPDKKQYLKSLNVVGNEPISNWLIDYWCNKDIKGLIMMPLSRHWIMHIEACQRIISRLHTI
ncbi:MAG: phage head-tail adapter protein [Muribaculaceae bacterium]|nr:phage head-tail adapter protein [Muribaculaceae bacterium]MDE6854988.1 phage head-tail adapter protein [Muribaculaceae bacterium]